MRVQAPAPPPVTRWLEPTWDMVMTFLGLKGYSALPDSAVQLEMRHNVQHRLIFRKGVEVYQTPSFHLSNVPLRAAETLFARLDVTKEAKRVKAWRCSAPEDMGLCCRTLQSVHEQCMGQSKALTISKQDPWLRVIATVVYFEATHSTRKNGRMLMHISFMYVMLTEMGHMQKPKDKNRREIAMTEEEEARVRAVVLRDLEAMADAGFRLSGRLLGLLGEVYAFESQSVLRAEEQHLNEARLRLEGIDAVGLEAWRDAGLHGENWEDERGEISLASSEGGESEEEDTPFEVLFPPPVRWGQQRTQSAGASSSSMPLAHVVD